MTLFKNYYLCGFFKNALVLFRIVEAREKENPN